MLGGFSPLLGKRDYIISRKPNIKLKKLDPQRLNVTT